MIVKPYCCATIRYSINHRPIRQRSFHDATRRWLLAYCKWGHSFYRAFCYECIFSVRNRLVFLSFILQVFFLIEGGASSFVENI